MITVIDSDISTAFRCVHDPILSETYTVIGDQLHRIVKARTDDLVSLQGTVRTNIDGVDYVMSGAITQRVERSGDLGMYVRSDNHTFIVAKTNAAPIISVIQTLKPNMNNEFIMFKLESTGINNQPALIEELNRLLTIATHREALVLDV